MVWRSYATNRLFGDNWSLAFFGAATPVAALFVLRGKTMKRILFSAILIISLVFALASCNKASIEISDDGYIVVNGEKTEIKAQGEKGDKGDTGPQGEQGEKGDKGDTGAQGTQGAQGEQGKSAYEIFKENYPDYSGDEKQWIRDVASGNMCNLFGHDCETEVVSSTCKEQGYTIYDCKICDYIENKEYVPLSDHNYLSEVCQWCGYHAALENAEYVTTEDGWIIAVSGEQAFLMTYNGDGKEMIFPSSYNEIALNFDYFSFDYKSVQSTLETLWICDAYQCDIENWQFGYFPELQKVILGNNVRSVGQTGLAGNEKLEYLCIGEGIETLETFCFGQCGNLQYIEYNAISAKSVGSTPYIIFEDSGIDSEGIILKIGDKVKYLPEWLFGSHYSYDSDPKFSKIIISENSQLETIGKGAFFRCVTIKEMVLPKTLKNIQEQAFEGTGIEKIYFGGNLDDWNLVTIEASNEPIRDAKVYFYSSTEPDNDGDYWHYDDNGNVVIWQ